MIALVYDSTVDPVFAAAAPAVPCNLASAVTSMGVAVKKLLCGGSS